MSFACTGCGDIVDPPVARCPRCSSFPIFRASRGQLALAIDGAPEEALPPIADNITMGEGGTALVRLAEPSSNSLAKLESSNPTCSFKDRGSAVLVSAALDPATPTEGIVVASTGNTSASVAAYAARAEIPCAIIIPAATGSPKLGQAAVHGPAIFELEGSFSECFDRARAVAGDERIVNATAVYSANPYVASANRAVAFELVGTLGTAPDWVTVPVGAGPLLGGIHVGFDELLEAGFIEHRPKMCAVQSRGCHPIVRGFEADRPVEAWQEPIGTEVGAIADPLVGYADDGEHTRAAVVESDGTAIALADEDIFMWRDRLASRVGMFVEPASAASVAAIDESPRISTGETAVAVLTGHGLKEPMDMKIDTRRDASVDDIKATLLAGG